MKDNAKKHTKRYKSNKDDKKNIMQVFNNFIQQQTKMYLMNKEIYFKLSNRDEKLLTIIWGFEVFVSNVWLSHHNTATGSQKGKYFLFNPCIFVETRTDRKLAGCLLTYDNPMLDSENDNV
jgi:hypothetical protein